MFCNYCRAPNPDDAVYCAACGQAVWHPSEPQTDERIGARTSSQSPANTRIPSPPRLEKPQAAAEISVNGTPVARAETQVKIPPPKSSDLSSLDYERMSDEELAQIQSAYAKVRVSPNAALMKELERRLHKSVSVNLVDVGTARIQTEPLPARVSTTPTTAANPEHASANDSFGTSPNVEATSGETNHGTGLSLPVFGSLGHRFTAYFADLIVIYLIVITVYIISTIFQLPLSASEGESQVVTFVAIFVYMIIAQSAYHTTIGKYIHGLEVRSQQPDNKFPSFWRILLRETIGRVVSSFFWGAGYWLAIKKPKKQAWSDEIAGTVVTTRPTNKVLTRALSAFVLVAFVLDVGMIGYGLYKEDRDKRYAALNKEIESVTEKITPLRDAIDQKTNRDELPNNWGAFLRWQEQMKSVKSDIDQYENQIDLMQGLLQRGISENLASSEAERTQFVKLKQVYAIRKRQADKLRQEADLIINCDGTKASVTSLFNDLQLYDSDRESLERQASQLLAEIKAK
jgi:uncharacterized RDD family membrane protein YckC